MVRLFRKILSPVYNEPVEGFNKKIEVGGALFLASISAIMTILNVFRKDWVMVVAVAVLTLGFLMAAHLANQKRRNFARNTMAVLVALVFTMFAITGQMDGFAILWIILVPIVSFSLLGFQKSFWMSGYFLVFLVLLFNTPLSKYVEDDYSATFRQRFPLLYLASFGAVVFLMSQRESLYYAIGRQARVDALTGLYNRHHLNEVCKMMEEEKPERITVVSLDLNGLKDANDKYGHEAGDELLCGCADLLRAAFPDDHCFRVGGDEFVVLSTRNCIEQSLHVLEEGMQNWRGKLVERLSLAVGCVTVTGHPNCRVEDLLRISDKRMYEEKSKYYRVR